MLFPSYLQLTRTNNHRRFQCDLTLKKQFIGQSVEALLVNGIQ
jgi:hypothetical protein